MAKENQNQGAKPDMQEVMQMVSELTAENKYLKKQLSQAVEQIKFMNVGEVYKRLDLLWNIITLERTEEIFGPEFFYECVEDFKEIMFPPISEKEEKKDE